MKNKSCKRLYLYDPDYYGDVILVVSVVARNYNPGEFVTYTMSESSTLSGEGIYEETLFETYTKAEAASENRNN